MLLCNNLYQEQDHPHDYLSNQFLNQKNTGLLNKYYLGHISFLF
jgi:hypothetical protein